MLFRSDSDMNAKSSVLPIFTDLNGEPDTNCNGLKQEDLPILPLRNMVLFPGVALPVSIGRNKSLKLVKEAYTNKCFIGVVCQIDMNENEPGLGDVYHIGTIAEVIKILEMPDQTTTVILQGKKRFILNDITSAEPFLKGIISLFEVTTPEIGRAHV